MRDCIGSASSRKECVFEMCLIRRVTDLQCGKGKIHGAKCDFSN